MNELILYPNYIIFSPTNHFFLEHISKHLQAANFTKSRTPEEKQDLV